MFYAFKREKAERKAESENGSDREPEPHLTYVRKILHSLFAKCEEYSSNTMVYNAKGLYPHKAQKSNEFSSSAVSIKEYLLVTDAFLKHFPDAFDMHPSTDRDRANSIGTCITFSFFGRLARDLLTCKKLVLPNT